MNFETSIRMTQADHAAAAAVVGLRDIELGGSGEFVIRSILAKAAGDSSALAKARRHSWVLTLESSSDFQYFARVYTDGKPLAAGSVQRVLDLLFEAERRVR